MTHLVADLALEVAGGWWTRLLWFSFRLQHLDASYFELFYCWLAWGTPISSVHRRCFQFRRCNAAAVQCGLEAVLEVHVQVSRVLKVDGITTAANMNMYSCIYNVFKYELLTFNKYMKCDNMLKVWWQMLCWLPWKFSSLSSN